LNDQPRDAIVTDQDGSGNETQTEKEAAMSQTSTPSKTRKPYDGSYAHGVSLKNVKTILEYDRSLGRLEKRFDFLRDEYVLIKEQFTATDDMSERATLLKDKSSKESQIGALLELRKTLTGQRKEIEEKERVAQQQAENDFKDFSFGD
jgi:hypothetical protein